MGVRGERENRADFDTYTRQPSCALQMPMARFGSGLKSCHEWFSYIQNFAYNQ